MTYSSGRSTPFNLTQKIKSVGRQQCGIEDGARLLESRLPTPTWIQLPNNAPGKADDPSAQAPTPTNVGDSQGAPGFTWLSLGCPVYLGREPTYGRQLSLPHSAFQISKSQNQKLSSLENLSQKRVNLLGEKIAFAFKLRHIVISFCSPAKKFF